MTLALIVALALGGLGVYVAYRDPKLGAAILVGIAIVTALYVIWDKDPSVFETNSPPSVTVPSEMTQVPPGAVPAASLPPSTILAPSESAVSPNV